MTSLLLHIRHLYYFIYDIFSDISNDTIKTVCVRVRQSFANGEHTSVYTCDTLQHTLQHTATHMCTHTISFANGAHGSVYTYDTLQHTATHCNTLQHTATHYNTLQQHTCVHTRHHSPMVRQAPLVSYVYTCMLQCVAVCCSVLQCVAVCCSVLHSM